MTQITAEQQERLQATAERAIAKLSACVDALPDDERTVLTAVLQQMGGAGDTGGYWFPNMMAGMAGRSAGSSGGLDAVNSVDWQKVYDALSVKW